MNHTLPGEDRRAHAGRAHRLVSHDGRVVRVVDGELRCGEIAADIEPSAACAIERGRLVFHAADAVAAARTFRTYREGSVPAGHFRVISMGRPLVADDEGRLVPGDQDRSTCFSLIRSDTIRLVSHILRNRWIEAGSDRLVEPGLMRAGPGPVLSIDGEDIPFPDIENSHPAGDGHDPEPKDLTIRYSGWKIRRLILFKPLIYTAAFRHQGLFDCAALAIASATRFGDYSGDVMLLTSEDRRRFADALPEELRNRVHVAVCSADDVLDYLVTRFRIVDVDAARAYQPVVYMDTDMLVDAPLEPLLRKVAESSAVHLTSLGAGTLMDDSNYYGSALFAQDPSTGMDGAEGYNSGIIAFRNVDDVAETFERLSAAIYGYAAASGERMFYPAADQCMANYVLHREGRGSGTLLTPWVVLANHTLPLDRPARRGFVHFIGGVGNAGPKIVQMERYLRMMEDGEP